MLKNIQWVWSCFLEKEQSERACREEMDYKCVWKQGEMMMGESRWPVDGAVWPVTSAAPARPQPSHQAEVGWHVPRHKAGRTSYLMVSLVVQATVTRQNKPVQRKQVAAQQQLHQWAPDEARTPYTPQSQTQATQEGTLKPQ